MKEGLNNCACALTETLISRFRAIVQAMLCSIRHVLVHTHKIEGIYACATAEQTKSAENQSGKESELCLNPNNGVDKNTNHEFSDKIVAIFS